ncbi:hypothetical protein C8Q70DRAFT_1049365 [Cubamyces menziesii]|nr:hypothetical protein C8Q70DRAFT_1052378 [Cubamyces menziesii]KAI0665203.1 hypothetical protein C8Q70DRAFT_1049365 [Cubamyces menziesii]
MPTLQVSIPHIDLAMVTALVLLWTKIRSRSVMLAGWRNLGEYNAPLLSLSPGPLTFALS